MMKTLGGRYVPYLYILPVVVISGVLIYFSIGFNTWASLTDWNGLTRMNFVGLDNYAALLSDRTFWTALRNTLVFM
ncbi:MAG TPA: sugar ABC transporter permease, partial [Microbacterium sp.]|nr:sugar ABC transporter permease [Microbacterium sp.]